MEEPVEVDKVCSSVDVMPTLANLMGWIMIPDFLWGDILSPSPGWWSLMIAVGFDLGRYDASENMFTPNRGKCGDE